jgi:hypothetical protein
VGKGPIHERAEYWVVSKKDQIWKRFSFNLMTIQMKAHSHFEDLLKKVR